MTEPERNIKIGKYLKLFHLQEKSTQYFEGYSRGDRQKFAILAALLHEPKLLLIDEPIVGLDPSSIEIAKKLFQDFAKQGGTILIVTHTLPVAQEISHRIGLLQKGKLVAEGTFTELKTQAKQKRNARLEDVYKTLTQ